MKMDALISFLGGVAFAGAIIGTFRRTPDNFTEEVLMAALIRKRADRYIGAVAKMKVESEVKAAADKQAADRLTEQGVRPSNQ
jgi:hypothetical protein